MTARAGDPGYSRSGVADLRLQKSPHVLTRAPPSTVTACPAGCRRRRSRWCSRSFFVLPLCFVVMVSFWDYNDYQMLPTFTTRSYTESFEGCLTDLPNLCTMFKTYVSTVEILSASSGR